MIGHDPIDPLSALLLGRLPVIDSVRLDRGVAGHPAEDRVGAVLKLPGADIREIALKGKEARFVETERGKFAAKG